MIGTIKLDSSGSGLLLAAEAIVRDCNPSGGKKKIIGCCSQTVINNSQTATHNFFFFRIPHNYEKCCNKNKGKLEIIDLYAIVFKSNTCVIEFLKL